MSTFEQLETKLGFGNLSSDEIITRIELMINNNEE